MGTVNTKVSRAPGSLDASEVATVRGMVSGAWNENQQDVIDAGGGLVVADESGHLTGPGGAIADSGGGGTTVVDNLTSTSTTSALSANQGRVLNEKIPPVVDDLTTGGSTVALSAQQGVALKGYIDALNAGTAGGYPEVATYAALPTTATDGDTYVVLAASGVYFISRKPAGLYRYASGSWVYLGEVPDGYFTDNVLKFFDNADVTKQLAFELSGISSGTTRTLTAPDASGTIALTSDVSTKQDTLVSGGNIKTVGSQSLLGSGNITRASLIRGAPSAFQINGITGVAPYYFPQLCLTYTSTVSISAGNIYYFPFWVSGPLDINRIGCRVATAGTGTARCALYASGATTGLPSALVCDSGDLDTTATGDKEGVVSATLDAGLYWLAVRVSATCSIYGNSSPGGMYMGSTSSSSGAIRGLLASASYAAYPSTAETITGVSSASVFGIWVRNA